MRRKRGASYGMGFRSILKMWSVLLLMIYVAFFMVMFYAAFLNRDTYSVIVEVNSLGEAFLEAVMLIPLTLVLIVVGLFVLFREKSRLNANLSYELRTHLNGIIGYVGLLQEQQIGKINPRQQEDLEVIHRNAMEILQSIDDVDSLWR